MGLDRSCILGGNCIDSRSYLILISGKSKTPEYSSGVF